MAKVLGGSSSHNYLSFAQGNPSDYNRWRDMGNIGWGYDDVLPYFKKLEDMHAQELLKKWYVKPYYIN